MGSAIEWTDETWNPTTGCDRVSPGCDHCYALTLAGRLKRMGQPKYQRDGDPETSGPGFALTEHADTLAAPLELRVVIDAGTVQAAQSWAREHGLKARGAIYVGDGHCLDGLDPMSIIIIRTGRWYDRRGKNAAVVDSMIESFRKLGTPVISL